MATIPELARFLKDWLHLANEADPSKTLPVFRRGEVSIITDLRPYRQSQFILDFTINGGKSLEIYKVTACGSTYIASVGVTEPDPEGLIGLDPCLRNEKVFGMKDLIRALNTYHASAGSAKFILAMPSVSLNMREPFSGDLLFEEELLIAGKRLQEVIGYSVQPTSEQHLANFVATDGFDLTVNMLDGRWFFALAQDNRSLVRFAINPHGKLGKEPYDDPDFSRERLIEILHEFVEPIRAELTKEFAGLRHARHI